MKNKKVKLALSELEKEMEVISREEMRSFKGGVGEIIVDPNGIIGYFKSYIYNKISDLEFSKDFIITHNGEDVYNAVLSKFRGFYQAIEEMENSEKIYEVDYFDLNDPQLKTKKGIVMAPDEHGIIKIYFDKNYSKSIPTLAEETWHMYQHENGDYSNKSVYELEKEAKIMAKLIELENTYFEDTSRYLKEVMEDLERYNFKN